MSAVVFRYATVADVEAVLAFWRAAAENTDSWRTGPGPPPGTRRSRSGRAG